MITVSNQRYESDGRKCGEAFVKSCSAEQAAWELVKFELGFGGHIVQVDDTSLTVKTSILGARFDVVSYSSELSSSLRPLHLMGALWTEVTRARLQQKISMELVESNPIFLRPIWAAHALPVFAGQATMKATLIAFCMTHDVAHEDLRSMSFRGLVELAIFLDTRPDGISNEDLLVLTKDLKDD